MNGKGKRYLRKIGNIICCICVYFFLDVLSVKAIEYPEPVKMRVTCYTATEGSITASGKPVHEGIAAAKREWMGYVAIVYDSEMNLIGFFEITDTGSGIDTDGDGKGDSIQKGTSIDIYRDTLERCYDWVGEYGDYLYVQMVKAEG